MIVAEHIHCEGEAGIWPEAEPQVVFCDNHLLVLLKPFNLPCQPDDSGDPSLVDWARSWIQTTYAKPGAAWVGLLHRLDRPAAGLVALARTSKAAARLSGQFRRRTARRLYLARVHGRPAEESGRLVHRLIKDTTQHRSRLAPPGQGQEAILDWRLVDIATELGAAGRRPVSELEIQLETGRSHQIRAQLAAAGHPLLGDLKYGAPDPLPGRNIALFARELELAHPLGGRRLRFIAEAPLRWMTAATGPGR